MPLAAYRKTMRYRLQKENNTSRRSYGRYVARAVHDNTVTAEQLQREIERNCSAKVSDCQLVLCELADTIVSHLHDGDIIELPFLGKIKLEIECQAVDDEALFDVRKHIKGVRLHSLPLSRRGIKTIYHGITYTRENR